jgi:photosystem II stability/assembly factor-like uncharacterized protein
MRKITTLILSLLAVTLTFGKSVTKEHANQVANKYFSANSLKANSSVANSFSQSYNGITTYYVFNYTGGGFVVVSADDAVIPILAQSDKGFFEEEISNPSVKYWFDNYSKEIAYIISSNLDNSSTIQEWNRILSKNMAASTLDIPPLTTTTWDQVQYYNYYCPLVSSGGSAGKAYTGCVATAMGQIMKYHNFPPKGISSHTYNHPTYGIQSVDFGATNYNFSNMGNMATSSSYQEIATLLYHAGVAVDMDYSGEASGAYSGDVPGALVNYFNYDPDSIGLASQSDYSDVNWKNLLKTELDAHRPLYYSGSGNDGGHAWVCDGYRNSDGKFHMNWGWGGTYNNWYTIGILNPGSTFNANNAVIHHIIPGNPNLIVRFVDLEAYNMAVKGMPFEVNFSVLVGSPIEVRLYIDSREVVSTTDLTYKYIWNTTSASLGKHIFKVEAIDATDTVAYSININLSDWEPQSSSFAISARGINYIHAVDSVTVWATSIDGTGTNTINEFTKTSDGGKTWTPGQVLGGTSYGLGNICGLDSNIAYVSVYNKLAQDIVCGVYKTSDGGLTWTHLTGALQGSASFADNVWFWNENEGMCHGDVKDDYFEIYTTSDGGKNWSRVPQSNIGAGATPASGEGGWTSVIQAVEDSTIIFGSNKAKLYISHDRGYTWTISNTGISPITDGINKICFKDKLNGIVAQTNTTQVLKETHNGGTSWQTLAPLGPFQSYDIAYVPGTKNTFVSTGSGASYSFDGGHSWAQAIGTENFPFLAVDFVNNHSGWAGSFSQDATTNGVYNFIGILVNPVSELTAQPVELTATLSWTAPSVYPLSFNIYRNDTLIANTTSTQYLDSPVAKGSQIYCVTAVYAEGESPRTCTSTWIALGISNSDEAAYRLYPNPANEIINLITPVKFSEVRIISMLGKIVYRNQTKGTNLHILTQGFEPGMYILQIYTRTQVISKKVSIIR